jgi:hypothetical protein
MLLKNVEVGGTYTAKVSGWLTEVKLLRVNQYGGWDALNLRTGCAVRIRSAQRLRARVKDAA